LVTLRSPLLLLLLLLVLSGSAQQFTATVKGQVTDKESRQSLAEVLVVILPANSSPLVTTTDAEGKFKLLNVPVGRHPMKLSLVGYQEINIAELAVNTGKETMLNFSLEEKVTSLKEVAVTSARDKTKSANEFAAVSARSFSADEMMRYAGTLNDPARMAQSFAGVMTANDENNQIVVRGNSPRGLLWRMEGIEIPNPNHFAGSEGSTGGGVSILSANMLTNTDFYSGAFAAEYGNALSGVFDLNLRKGNTDKREYTFQAGILGLEAALEGPFSKKYGGSYLVNYRYSTLDILALMGLKIGGNVLPKYQDLAFNFYFPTKKMGSFTLFGLGGLSSLGEKAKQDTSAWTTFSDKSQYEQSQAVGSLGITHLFLFKDQKTYLKTVVAFSHAGQGSQTDTLSNTYEAFPLEKNRFINQTLRAHLQLNTKLNPRNSVRTGIIVNWYWYRLKSDKYSFLTQQTDNLVYQTGQAPLYQAYAQWKHRFSERASLYSGLHLTFSSINNKLYLEPRMGAEFQLTENQTLSAGLGLHSRIDAFSTYTSHPSNKNLEFSRAFHSVVGYQLRFLKDFRLKTELYFQYLFQLPVGVAPEQRSFSIVNYDDGFVNFPLQSSGLGYNYGIEITLEKFFTKRYFFTLTTSLFQSKYKARDNTWRNTAYNAGYVLNALGGKEFVVGKKKNNIIGLNAKLIWRGGQRYTPVDLNASIAANETVRDETRAFDEQLPDYFRIDFGTSFRRNKKKYAWVISFDAQNIINRQNVATQIFDLEQQAIVTRRNLGIVPVISWKIQF